MTSKKNKIHVKEGDQVQIITGEYKGTIGEVKKIIRKDKKVVIKGVNLKTRHIRPKQENEAGQIIQVESPIHSSNVMLYSSKEKIASRYSKTMNPDNIKKRILKKTGETI